MRLYPFTIIVKKYQSMRDCYHKTNIVNYLQKMRSFKFLEIGGTMKLSIGENIKFLRKSQDITQEQLSEMLGVSCQSVSRWESGVCYPDMELLPVLAEIFAVTVDKLLGVDDSTEKKDVDAYLNRFQVAINCGNIDECISIAREGVAEYPNNYVLLNKLMYALFVSGDDTGNIPNWKENMEKYDAEITALGERITKYCPDQQIRLEAAARLAFNHCEHGRKEIGRQIYETLPSMISCREPQMWWSLQDEEKLPFLREQIRQSYDIFQSFVWLLATCEKLPAMASIAVIEKVEAMNALITDGKQYDINSWGNARINYDKAKLYAKTKNVDLACKYLKLAAQKAAAFDGRAETQAYESLLLGNVTEKRLDFETADTRALCRIMAEDWLANEAFDFLRNTTQFQEVMDML